MSNLEAIEKFLKAEWEVISTAPFHFSVAVIGIGILIWLASRFFCKQQIGGLEKENKANDAAIRALRERVSLAQEKSEASDAARQSVQEKFEASHAARQDTEMKLKEIQTAVELDAAKRRAEVSSDVATAVTATVISMRDLREKQADLNESFSDVLTEDDILAAILAGDVLSANDLKRIPSREKDKG